MAKKKSTIQVKPPPLVSQPSLEIALEIAAKKLSQIKSDDPQRMIEAYGLAVDLSVPRGKIVTDKLPEELRAEFQTVLAAADMVEHGNDEGAKAALQAIGLRSPFLEWKLFLRGLSAFYVGDDARALENWQRLNCARLPSKLAAPLQAHIDTRFLAAQSPFEQKRLQHLYQLMQPSVVSPGMNKDLKSLMKQLVSGDGLDKAFRMGDSLVTQLRATAPKVLPRLQRVFFAAVIGNGQPTDATRFARLFNLPQSHPEIMRMLALGAEAHEMTNMSEEGWVLFLLSLDTAPDLWPGELGKRIRAVVWLRIANIVHEIQEEIDEYNQLSRSERSYQDPPPKKPKHALVDCLKNSLKYAPNLLGAHEAMLSYLADQDDQALAAIAAGRELLQHYPDHLDALKTVAMLLADQDQLDEALEMLSKAQRVNSLDKSIVSQMNYLKLLQVRGAIERNQFATARNQCKELVALLPAAEKHLALIRWASCEWRAKAPERAEELLAQAYQLSASRIVIDFSMLIEVIRMKLPKPLKTRFDTAMKAELANSSDTHGAIALANIVLNYRKSKVTYVGYKTHERKVLDFVRSVLQAKPKEADTVSLLDCLCKLNNKLTKSKDLIDSCVNRFPSSLDIRLIAFRVYVEHVKGSKQRTHVTDGKRHLETAKMLLDKLPPSPQKDAKQVEFDALHEEWTELVPPIHFGGMFSSFFDRMFGGKRPSFMDFLDDDDDDDF